MKIDRFYEVHFLGLMPYLVVVAFLCLGILKSPDFLAAEAAAEAGVVSDSIGLTERADFSEGNLTEEKNEMFDEVVGEVAFGVKEAGRADVMPGVGSATKLSYEVKSKSKSRIEVARAGAEADKGDIGGKINDRKIGLEYKTAGARSEVKAVERKTEVGRGSLRSGVGTESVTIKNKTVGIFQSNNTLTDSGDLVAKFGDKFLYGHNTANVFASLSRIRLGEKFQTNTASGEVKTFVVAKIEIMTKDRTADFMNGIAFGRYMGHEYGVILMTCTGEPRPNRDATHRLLVFANEA